MAYAELISSDSRRFGAHSHSPEGRPAQVGAAALLALTFAGALLFPTHPDGIVRSLPCSAIPATAIASLVGTEMQLMPSDGHVCIYDGRTAAVQVYVTALHHAPLPQTIAGTASARVRPEGFMKVYVRTDRGDAVADQHARAIARAIDSQSG
ncbi:MAG: hypothetical protein NVS2B17_13800 [Candidatus Velthaea sp.]